MGSQHFIHHVYNTLKQGERSSRKVHRDSGIHQLSSNKTTYFKAVTCSFL